MNLEKFNLLSDIYYNKQYSSLYLEENESIFEFTYREQRHSFYQISIKRPILKIAEQDIDDGFFDLETAYGYGGFHANTDNKQFLLKAVNAYKERCIEENIIAEFFRLHPFNFFTKPLNDFFDMYVHDRDVVVINLEQSTEQRWTQYSATTRNVLRRAYKELSCNESHDIDSFIDLYYSTMKKNNADDFYFFNKEYFEELISIENIKLFKVTSNNNIIAMAFFMFGQDVTHYHLSANDYNFSKLNANYFILDYVFEYAKSLGQKYFLLGGGSSPNKNDSLLKFKLKFSKELMPFMIAGKIYNNKKYDEYNRLWQGQAKRSVNFFLKYRLNI